jgi:hypothetical protein
MKKFIHYLSVLGFALLISAGVVSAQSTKSVDADVPFTFNVGEETYASGNYKLHITGDAAGGSVVTISDDKGNALQTMVATGTGSTSRRKSELVFERRGNERYLVGISLPERGYRLARVKKARTALTRNIPSVPGSNVKQGL